MGALMILACVILFDISAARYSKLGCQVLRKLSTAAIICIGLLLLSPGQLTEGFGYFNQKRSPQRWFAHNRQISFSDTQLGANTVIGEPPSSSNNDGDIIAFTGGGIFFWWQAGWVSQAHVPDDARFVGASAGSLTALCAKCGVGADEALVLALRLCDEHSIFERPLGLAGKWGGLVREWLEALLPLDAHERCRGKVHILVSTVEPASWPPLRRTRVTDFTSRSDLIDCAMASVHIPLFMNGELFTSYRGKLCFDGSFLQQPSELVVTSTSDCDNGEVSCSFVGEPQIVVDHKDDEVLRKSAFLHLKPSPELVRDLLERGADYARRTDAFINGSTGSTQVNIV